MAVYRNLQEQVFENAKDIEQLQQIVSTDISTEAIQNLITQTLNDYGIKYNANELQLDKPTSVNDQFIVRYPSGASVVDLVNIFGHTYIGGNLELDGTLNCRNGKIKVGNTEITEEQLQRLLQLIA